MALSDWAGPPSATRRGVLAGLGVLALAGRAEAQSATGGAARLNAWLTVGADDTVTVIMSQSEMGQGISTTLPAALADELGADWSRLRTEWSGFDPAYRHPQYQWMFTGNSESSSTFYSVMRAMGAGAREMLTEAAAQRLGVPTAELTVEGGRITHAASGRSVTFGQVAEAASRLPVPKAPRLKADAELRLIGKPQARRDVPAKVDGSAIFGIDVQVPGMAVAALRRAPSPGGRLASYDAAGLKVRPGVLAVVEIPGGLAVVAERYWTAKRALDEAGLVFEAGPLKAYSTEGQRADHARRLAAGPFETKAKTGDAAPTLAAGRVIEATYELPVQAHATMEPMNATAHVTAERCELWLPTQGVEITLGVARQVTGLPDAAIIIHRTLLGGGFGRRLLTDFVKIAITVSKAAGRPVKVIWSREEDITYDAFRPPMTHQIRAALGADGRPVAMAHKVVSPSHMLYIFPRGALGVKADWDQPVAPPPAYDGMSVEGVAEPPYAIPNYLVEHQRVETPLTVSVWRTTGHGPNNFALESFIDELAQAAGQDPLAYRLALAAGDPRAVAVLRAVGEMCGWGRPAPKGRGRGLALAKAFNGYIAQVVEVSRKGRDVKVHRVWSAVDCGQTLDPGIAAANVEGGVVWGLSGLRTEVAFADGVPLATNFDGFDPVHLWETPMIETRFIESGGKIGGTGEVGPVPTHAAFANAVVATGGRRLRALPIGRAGYRLV